MTKNGHCTREYNGLRQWASDVMGITQVAKFIDGIGQKIFKRSLIEQGAPSATEDGRRRRFQRRRHRRADSSAESQTLDMSLDANEHRAMSHLASARAAGVLAAAPSSGKKLTTKPASAPKKPSKAPKTTTSASKQATTTKKPASAPVKKTVLAANAKKAATSKPVDQPKRTFSSTCPAQVDLKGANGLRRGASGLRRGASGLCKGDGLFLPDGHVATGIAPIRTADVDALINLKQTTGATAAEMRDRRLCYVGAKMYLDRPRGDNLANTLNKAYRFLAQKLIWDNDPINICKREKSFPLKPIGDYLTCMDRELPRMIDAYDKMRNTPKKLTGATVKRFNVTDLNAFTNPYFTPESSESVVTNQGQCMSCWAEAAASSFEIAHRKAMQKDSATISISRQQLIDCVDQKYDTCKCGGDAIAALEWLHVNQPIARDNYRRTKRQNACSASTRTPMDLTHTTAPGWDPAFSKDEFCVSGECEGQNGYEVEILMNVIADGPYIAYVDSSKWINYTGGIFPAHDPKMCSSNASKGGHIVEIIGFGEEDGIPYYLVKNSWSKKWGEGGHHTTPDGHQRMRYREFGVQSVQLHARAPGAEVSLRAMGRTFRSRADSFRYIISRLYKTQIPSRTTIAARSNHLCKNTSLQSNGDTLRFGEH